MNDLPTDIRDALLRHSEAARVFERLLPSHRREYVRWVDEAKKPETRTKRIGSMMERLTAPRGA
ncbi:YdeI/OmpD-associated family protein [Microvirga puerhi]|uniref:YdeI/OmpD-associated family protein n=1 Tax=Microvirga puerhi TaxID=2876078 RepID=A0ABS7VNQ0_9HYPH|nr:YdeI/OmpD-associated family protein [Microvirga puerhi]MBZ6076710.1 YdeI/OmpD-associated family protein [Microvirga puerhi]